MHSVQLVAFLAYIQSSHFWSYLMRHCLFSSFDSLYYRLVKFIGFRLFRATGLAFAIRPKGGVARQGRRGGFHCYRSKGYSKFASWLKDKPNTKGAAASRRRGTLVEPIVNGPRARVCFVPAEFVLHHRLVDIRVRPLCKPIVHQIELNPFCMTRDPAPGT